MKKLKPLAGFIYASSFAFTFVWRLVTHFIGGAQISPLMAGQLAGAKAVGPWTTALYGAMNIVLIDLATNEIGLNTPVCALVYGLVGVIGWWYLRTRKSNIVNLTLLSVGLTIFYDLATGLTLPVLQYHMSFYEALVGQIEFTMRHLLGNVLFTNIFFAATFAPWLAKQLEGSAQAPSPAHA